MIVLYFLSFSEKLFTKLGNKSFIAEHNPLGSLSCKSPILCCARCAEDDNCLFTHYQSDNTCEVYGNVEGIGEELGKHINSLDVNNIFMKQGEF